MVISPLPPAGPQTLKLPPPAPDQNQKKPRNRQYERYQKTIDDLIAVFEANGLESPRKARALGHIVDFLKYIKNITSREMDEWKKIGHSGCDSGKLPDQCKPKTSWLEGIRTKLEEHGAKIEKMEAGKKIEFMDYFEIKEYLDENFNSVELFVIQHKFDEQFNLLVDEGYAVLSLIEKLQKELEEKMEPKTEANKAEPKAEKQAGEEAEKKTKGEESGERKRKGLGDDGSKESREKFPRLN